MRKGKPIKRTVLPDPVYNSENVTKFINKLMISGKRGVAQNILYSAFEIIKKKTQEEPLEVFERAIKNVKPVLELKTRRIGGANYPIPIPVLEGRDLTLGLRWIVNYARIRNDGRSMEEKLAAELIDAANGTGASVKKKDDTHKMAEANKAFSHYRW